MIEAAVLVQAAGDPQGTRHCTACFSGSYPVAVTGVAVWEDVPEKIGKVNRFSIYVGGLSNGIFEETAADGTTVIKRKTLQLDFFKPTDDTNPRIDDIRPDDNKGLGGENWVYRASSTRKAAEKPKDDK